MLRQVIKLDKHKKTFILAEAGINHNGSIKEDFGTFEELQIKENQLFKQRHHNLNIK